VAPALSREESSMTTPPAFDPKVFERLLDICGRFRSLHDGEIANAVRIADKQLQNLGMTWAEFLMPPIAAATASVKVNGAAPNAPPPPPSGKPQPQAKAYRRAGGSARAHFMATHVTVGDHRRVAAELLKRGVSFANQREAEFVNDQAASPYDYLTVRQFEWLAGIAARHGIKFNIVGNP